MVHINDSSVAKHPKLRPELINFARNVISDVAFGVSYMKRSMGYLHLHDNFSSKDSYLLEYSKALCQLQVALYTLSVFGHVQMEHLMKIL